MWLWSFTWQQWFYWLKSLPMAFILKDFFPRSNVKCSKIDFFFFFPPTVKLGGAFLQLITTVVYMSRHT